MSDLTKSRIQLVLTIAVPILLAIALAAVCIWSSNTIQKKETEQAQLQNEVEASYRQAVYQLSDNVNDMQTALKKLQVTGSTSQHVLLLSDVWRLSGAAVANMGNIPASHVDTAELNTFIVRVGDYARVLSRKVLEGGILVNEDYQQLDQLYEASVEIGNELRTRIDKNEFPSMSLNGEGYYATVQTDSAAGEQTDQSGKQEGQEDKESISDYPTLIYDGPFSESNEQVQARGLGSGEVSEEQAKAAALTYLGGGQLTGSGLEDGTIPVYGFYGTDAAGRNVEITITRQGGDILWMMADTPIGENGVPEESVTKKMSDAARAFLNQHGYRGMEPTYAQFYEGVGVFNFAATENNVILYADLIKVYVEKSSGQVVGVDANNYLMCHGPREIPAPVITQEEARASVAETLQVVSERMALIPVTSTTEALCYEFKGNNRGTDFIVYINAVTGAEQEIFEILNSDEGQLVV